MSLRTLALVTVLAFLWAGCPPAPMNDAGAEDAGEETPDAGRRDAGPADAGPVDAGSDAGAPDAGPVDAGLGDGGCVYRLEALPGSWSTGRPLTIELADMNGDGQLDFIVATSSTLEVRLNNGQGAFEAQSLLAPITPQTLVVRDVDGDGRLDVVSVDVTGVLTVLPGNGDGTLSLGARLDAGGAFSVPLDTALADLDLDGRPDFVILEVGGSVPALRTVRGRLDGGAPRATNGSHRLVLADVTGDGLTDALVGNAQYGMALHAGDGDGGFAAPTVSLASTAVNSVAIADVNGDGVADAVCASGFYEVGSGFTLGGGVTVLPGTDGGLGPPAQSPSGRDIIWALVLADLNRDGALDAVISRFGSGAGVEVLSGDDAGLFAPLARVASRSVWALAVGDLDEDGWLDVVTGSGAGSNGEVQVLLGGCR